MLKEEDVVEGLSSFDTSTILDNLVDKDNKYVSYEKYSQAIIVNTEVLKEKGFAIPTTYDDLLKPEYKELITIPNLKSSGTGYAFYLALVNERGIDEALKYFDLLNSNILQYVTSSSGPVTSLVQGESAIGLGMIMHAVEQINEGESLSIVQFADG